MIMHGQPIDEYPKELLQQNIRSILNRMESWTYINEKFAKSSLEQIKQGNIETGISILRDGLDNTISMRTPKGDPWLAFCLGNAYRDIAQFDYAEYWYRYAIDTLPVPKVRKYVTTVFEEMENERARVDKSASSFFTIFMLECEDESLFTWYSDDLASDYNAHKAGVLSEYTKRRRPLKIVHLEKAKTEEEAKARANVVRTMSRKQKMKLASLRNFG